MVTANNQRLAGNDRGSCSRLIRFLEEKNFSGLVMYLTRNLNYSYIQSLLSDEFYDEHTEYIYDICTMIYNSTAECYSGHLAGCEGMGDARGYTLNISVQENGCRYVSPQQNCPT